VIAGMASSPFQPVNFFTDLLEGTDGLTLRRMQIFVWTISLGMIFRDLAMPQFNETLLALLGISAGSDVGFRFPQPGAS
jgi:hypothetical protein